MTKQEIYNQLVDIQILSKTEEEMRLRLTSLQLRIADDPSVRERVL